eukprot:TRINITY_DN17283_c0_g1_i1.p1 TRINITY_DN17283_c0_g1~~TRINITY_DN17283_c0_g1_i1.p1  ORF type:complete len:650 (+),score=174.57 TRINITY_DN17283_c0_g1_i1:38-1987(+)
MMATPRMGYGGGKHQQQNRPSDPLLGNDIRMQVAVRVRPVEKGDANLSVDDSIVRCGAKEFAFDNVFTGDQQTIYEAFGRPMLQDAILGYNTCLFAYGQTGSGKTFTLQGLPGAGLPATAEPRPELEGVLPRFLRELSAYRKSKLIKYPSSRIHITMSILEIYNEEVRDLLGSKGDKVQRPTLAEDPETKQVVVCGASEIQIEGSEHALELLKVGVAARETAPTQMNDLSSRSHMILILTLKQRGPDDSPGWLASNIKFVDLAGSECLGRTGAEGSRRREGAHINKSLLALGKALSSFSTGSQMSDMRGTLRESKLTRLLSENFGGNSRTRMLAMVSPLTSNEAQTASTLSYANRAKNIKLHATQNKLKEAEANKVKQLQAIVESTRGELEAIKVELETTRDQVRDLEAERNEMAVDLEVLQQEKEKVEKARIDSELAREEAYSAMNIQKMAAQQLREQLTQDRVERDRLQSRVTEVEARNVELEAENADITEQLAREREAADRRLAQKRVRSVSKSRRSGSTEHARSLREQNHLNQQLQRAELTQDYLKEDILSTKQQAETTEMLRRTAVAQSHSLQAQLAGVSKELREEKRKSEQLKTMLTREAKRPGSPMERRAAATHALSRNTSQSRIGTPMTRTDSEYVGGGLG